MSDEAIAVAILRCLAGISRMDKVRVLGIVMAVVLAEVANEAAP